MSIHIHINGIDPTGNEGSLVDRLTKARGGSNSSNFVQIHPAQETDMVNRLEGVVSKHIERAMKKVKGGNRKDQQQNLGQITPRDRQGVPYMMPKVSGVTT